jgi:hypothetical protein
MAKNGTIDLMDAACVSYMHAQIGGRACHLAMHPMHPISPAFCVLSGGKSIVSASGTGASGDEYEGDDDPGYWRLDIPGQEAALGCECLSRLYLIYYFILFYLFINLFLCFLFYYYFFYKIGTIGMGESGQWCRSALCLVYTLEQSNAYIRALHLVLRVHAWMHPYLAACAHALAPVCAVEVEMNVRRPQRARHAAHQSAASTGSVQFYDAAHGDAWDGGRVATATHLTSAPLQSSRQGSLEPQEDAGTVIARFSSNSSHAAAAAVAAGHSAWQQQRHSQLELVHQLRQQQQQQQAAQVCFLPGKRLAPGRPGDISVTQALTSAECPVQVAHLCHWGSSPEGWPHALLSPSSSARLDRLCVPFCVRAVQELHGAMRSQQQPSSPTSSEGGGSSHFEGEASAASPGTAPQRSGGGSSRRQSMDAARGRLPKRVIVSSGGSSAQSKLYGGSMHKASTADWVFERANSIGSEAYRSLLGFLDRPPTRQSSRSGDLGVWGGATGSGRAPLAGRAEGGSGGARATFSRSQTSAAASEAQQAEQGDEATSQYSISRVSSLSESMLHDAGASAGASPLTSGGLGPGGG